jgi:hypothetical protein
VVGLWPVPDAVTYKGSPYDLDTNITKVFFENLSGHSFVRRAAFEEVSSSPAEHRKRVLGYLGV